MAPRTNPNQTNITMLANHSLTIRRGCLTMSFRLRNHGLLYHFRCRSHWPALMSRQTFGQKYGIVSGKCAAKHWHEHVQRAQRARMRSLIFEHDAVAPKEFNDDKIIQTYSNHGEKQTQKKMAWRWHGAGIRDSNYGIWIMSLKTHFPNANGVLAGLG